MILQSGQRVSENPGCALGHPCVRLTADERPLLERYPQPDSIRLTASADSHAIVTTACRRSADRPVSLRAWKAGRARPLARGSSYRRIHEIADAESKKNPGVRPWDLRFNERRSFAKTQRRRART